LFYLCFVGNNSKSSKRREKGRRRDKTKKSAKTGEKQQRRTVHDRAPMAEATHGRAWWSCSQARPCASRHGWPCVKARPCVGSGFAI